MVDNNANEASEPAWVPGLWLPWVLGAAAPLISAHILMPVTGKEHVGLTIGGLVLLFGLAGTVSRWQLMTKAWSLVGLICAGSASGVLMDVLIDHFLFAHDRNLFPIEMVMMVLLAFLPTLIGVFGTGLLLQAEADGASQAVQAARSPGAPALWNPAAIVGWSLLFSPVFGAALQWLNWRALGMEDQARVARRWLWASIALWGAYGAIAVFTRSADTATMLSYGLQAAWFAAWFLLSMRPQIDLVSVRYGRSYVRQRWGEPLFLACVCLAAVFMLSMILAPLLQAWVSGRSR